MTRLRSGFGRVDLLHGRRNGLVARLDARNAQNRHGAASGEVSSVLVPVTTPLRVTYELASAKRRETVNASELSLGGVFLETKERPAVGAFVTLEIESGATKVELDGRVLSVRPGGFAVSFIDLPNDVAASLQFILTTRVPQRGTQLGLGAPEEGIPSHPSAPRVPAMTPEMTPSQQVAARTKSSSEPPNDDAYAPRYPTPRMTPVAPPSSSHPIPPIALGPPSSGQLPPLASHSYGPPPAPMHAGKPVRATSPVLAIVIAILVIAILVVVCAIVVMFVVSRRAGAA
jgi:hypothetical protein